MRFLSKLATIALAIVASASAAHAAKLPLTGTLDLSLTTGDQLLALSSERAALDTGRSIAAIGDFNGDGSGDYAVSEPTYSAYAIKETGAVHVVFGGSGLKQSFTLGSKNGVSIYGATAVDRIGASVAAAGDLNGDGLADLIIGAPGAQLGPEGAASVEGRAYVIFGRSGSEPVNLAGGFSGFTINGERNGDAAGSAVGSIGDLNGDRRPELLVAAEKADAGGREDAGSLYVIFGKADTDSVQLGPTVVEQGRGIRIDGPQGSQVGGAYLGRAVDSIGDLNGDGKQEIVVSAPRAGNGKQGLPVGNVYVIWGQSSPQTIDTEFLGSKGYKITGSLSKAGQGSERSTNGDFLGQSLASVGDVNADGKPDFAIGAHLTDVNDRLNPGRVWVIYGSSDATDINLDRLDKQGFSVIGIDEQDQAGYWVDTAGDFNADGIDDLVITSPNADPLSRTEAGAVYVVWGSKKPAATLDLAEYGARALRVAGVEINGHLGSTAIAAGDVNGDGGADIAVAAPGKGVVGVVHFILGAAEASDAEFRDPAAGDPGFEEEQRLDKCKSRANVQAIVIDDGYIDNLDPERLRRQALEVYLGKPRNQGTVLGVTGFSSYDSDAEPIFDPVEIGNSGSIDPVRQARKKIKGQAGFPGWTGMLRSAPNANPSAQARVYLMDGVGFSEVNKLEGLTEGAPPSYVIAVGGRFEKRDGKAMKKLAEDTRGKFYSVKTGIGVEKAINAVESRLRCDIDLERFKDVLSDENSEEVNAVGLEDGTHSADVLMSWGGDLRDRVEIEEIEVLRGDDVVQQYDSSEIDDAYRAEEAADAAAGKIRKVIGKKGRGFRSIHLRGLKSGRLRITVKAERLNGRARVATQITQSRRRK